MQHALDLAWRGWGRVHPNPLVGAVVLDRGEVVGEGWHAEYGAAHAEPIALQAAGPRARGATLVVSLEPCAHQGKQPPCVEAIIRAGVARVVAALPDPNPIAAGGAALLGEAGVQIELGLERDAAEAQNAAFLQGLRHPERPFVALKLATSLDARIADLEGRSRWISGSDARAYVHWLRAGFDAIAVGGRTARTDDPSLTVRGAITPRIAPSRVIFDTGADLPGSLGVIRSATEVSTFVVASPQAPASRLTALERARVHVVTAPDLSGELQALRAAGLQSLLVEGGGRLAGALLSHGLCDRFYWIQSPLWLGERGVPAVAGLPSEPIARAERWRAVERRALGDDTLLVLDRR
jgi:diaminohydroxyphosphoribosylaminopyrimidine deaminase / 5-amino-6-(5-phosphoribosylamino)uracil reductase